MIESGYPLIFERGDDNKYIICINPSDREFYREIKFNAVADANNIEIKDNGILLKGESYAILSLKA